MEIDEVRAALSEEGLALTRALPAIRRSDALAVADTLRQQGHSDAVVAAAMTQARLRDKAWGKFSDFAHGMVFSPEGLEQATRLEVAALHARRFTEAGIERVADLTAGIGGDAMAFSALGIAVMAFERDEATALLADHNLRHWPSSVVVNADALSVVRDVDVDGIFADPSRRTPSGRKTNDPRQGAPPLASILALRDRFPALGVKLSPSIPRLNLPEDTEAEWVSMAGKAVEASLWCGPLIRHHGWGALLLTPEGAHRLAGPNPHPTVGPLEEYVFEPDVAVIRAHLIGEVASRVGGHLLDRRIAYVTAPRLSATPFATAYRVIDSLPFELKTLRSYLRSRGVGRITVKKRGVAVTTARLKAELKLRGNGDATLILTRSGGVQTVLVVEPVPSG